MADGLDASRVFELGMWLGYLEGIIIPEKTKWGDVKEALQNLSSYKSTEGVESIGLEAQSDLYRLARTYMGGKTRQLSEYDRTALGKQISTWHGRLDEVKKRWMMNAAKTTLDISKLCAGAHSFFENKEWSALSALEQQGLNEAAACLLSNNYTASEFMAVRTVESVLRRWYESKTGKTTEKQAAIFDIIDQEYDENKKRPKEIQQVFYFKHRRNAIAHPDMISNSEEASVTFTHSVETCSYIVDLSKAH
jgi:hypothetical protein